MLNMRQNYDNNQKTENQMPPTATNDQDQLLKKDFLLMFLWKKNFVLCELVNYQMLPNDNRQHKLELRIHVQPHSQKEQLPTFGQSSTILSVK